MSETRQLTFGGAFRSLRKDLKDMSHETRNAYLICATRDEKYYREDIQKIEERITEAVNKLPEYELFKSMHINGLHSIHGFSRHWEDLRKLKSGWEQWRSIRKMYEDSREWIAKRNWTSDKEILDDVHHYFIRSKPKGLEEDLEWTADYRVESCLIAVTQNLHTSTDSKDTDYKDTDSKGKDSKVTHSKDRQDLTSSLDPPPPYTAVNVMSDNRECYTFGKAYRTVIEYLEQLGNWTHLDDTGTESMTQDKFEDIRRRELKIIEIGRILPYFPLFEHMASGRLRPHWNFKDSWKDLVALCYQWMEPEASSIDWRNWKADHESIKTIIREIGKAQPKGFEKDFGWTDDFYARSDLKAIALHQDIVLKAVHVSNRSDSIHRTFGGAFRKLLRNFEHMHYLTESSNIRDHREQKWFWLRLGKLQTQIITAFKKISDYPLFIHMGGMYLFSGHEDFLCQWEPLRKLVSKWEVEAKWEETNSEWIGSAARIDKRDWHKERRTIIASTVKLDRAVPEGYEGEPNWKEDYLPVSKLVRKDVFFDEEKKVWASLLVR